MPSTLTDLLVALIVLPFSLSGQQISSASSDIEIYVFITRTKTKMYQAMCGCYGDDRRAFSKSQNHSDESLEDLHGAEQPKAQGLQARHGTIGERLDIAAVERLKGALSMTGPLELLMQRCGRIDSRPSAGCEEM